MEAGDIAGWGVTLGEPVTELSPVLRWLAISSSPSMQLAYARSSTSTEWPARRATAGTGTPAFSQSDTAACRRSCGRAASGDATCSGARAMILAGCLPDLGVGRGADDVAQVQPTRAGFRQITIGPVQVHRLGRAPRRPGPTSRQLRQANSPHSRCADRNQVHQENGNGRT